MTKLYIGNLDENVTEKDLQGIFDDKNLKTGAISLKEGFAFVDCPDQEALDEAIEALSGYMLHNLTLQPEPSVSKSSRNVTSNSNTSNSTGTPTNTATRLLIKNIPQSVVKETLQDLMSSYGVVKDLHLNEDGVATVTYVAPDQAQQAKEKLDDFEFQGAKLKVEYVPRKPLHKTPGAIHKQEFPLRLLVPHQYVGAIIGRAGQTIRAITTKTNARVDVVRRDSNASAEKMVLILAAQAENCIDACKEILKVISNELEEAVGRGTETPTELELKILAHNNLCGRLIGRQGMVIKSIMNQTTTHITVSSVTNVNPLNQDRVVTIKGDLDTMCQAAEKVYVKLKAAFDSDFANMRYDPNPYYQGPHGGGMMMGGGPGPSMQPWGFRNMAPPPMMGYPNAGGYSPMSYAQQQGGPMTCYLYIPKSSVGAVIGTKGSYINFVKVESKATCQVQEKPDAPESNERPVKITGYPESVWKAQWYIFDKIKTEGIAGGESPKLRCEILVPRGMVGRIIGKGGQNVRDVQHISNAIIKLPEDPQASQPEEVPVQIIGNIYAQTLAQALIRQLMTQGQISHPSLPPRGGPGSRMPPRSYQQHVPYQQRQQGSNGKRMDSN